MNLFQVYDVVWRSARPTSPEDFYAVKKFGTVISLEGPEEDAKEVIELQGVTVISRPILFWEIYRTGITQEYLKSILATICGAVPPVLVHCQHGEDRTGLVIAALRVSAHRWPKDDALAEAIQYGYRHWLNFGLNKTWKEFAA
jgi:tyrosine-protein phosphatase SIW14